MNIIIQREPSNSKNTHGELLHNGDTICYTLEDVVREVQGFPVSEWKIRGATAIPAGTYRVTLEMSSRFGPDTLTINDVDGFDKIRMHGGNTEADTEGCPLLGLARTESGIRNCAPAVSTVKELVRDAILQGEEVWVEVVNGGALA